MNRTTTPQYFQAIAWGLMSLVCLLAILAWGRDYAWHLTPINAYQYFPLFGLLAFSLMWTHYAFGAIKRSAHLPDSALANYFEATSLAVLVLICLHPGLLIYQRYKDGYGLPPHSYETYVSHGLGWLTILGTISLFIFLAFEFRRRFSDREWWAYVLVANDLAMLAIFYHSLRLGSQIHGWFRTVWWFYGLSLIACLIYKYVEQATPDKESRA